MGNFCGNISYLGNFLLEKFPTQEIFPMWEPQKWEIFSALEIFLEIFPAMWEAPKALNSCSQFFPCFSTFGHYAKQIFFFCLLPQVFRTFWSKQISDLFPSKEDANNTFFFWLIKYLVQKLCESKKLQKKKFCSNTLYGCFSLYN